MLITLDSGIYVGPGKVGKNYKRRALKIWQKFEVFVMKKPENFIFPIFDKRTAF